MKDNTQLKETFRTEIPGFAEKERASGGWGRGRKAPKSMSRRFFSYA